MVVETFEINLQNSTNNVYFSGETVKGFVVLVLNEPLEIKGVKFLITGKAHTQWNVTRIVSEMNISGQVISKNFKDDFKDDQMYMNHEEILWNKGKPYFDSVTLQPGSYEFSFSVVIPTACPSSFEGSLGFVRYVCRASIGDNYKCKQPFTVVNMVDLNKETLCHHPVNWSETKSTRSRMFGPSGTIDCTVDLPRSGYVPGEMIQFHITVHNNSDAHIDDAEVKLEETVIYTAKCQGNKGTKCSTRTVAKQTHGLVKSKDSLIWKDQGLLIPSVAPTLKHCGLIDASYELEFKIMRNGTPLMNLFFPITIGTIPLHETVRHIEKTIHVQPYTSSPNEAIQMTDLSHVHKDYSNLPPPTYEIGYFKCVNIKESGRPKILPISNKYAPRYPYYDYLSNMSTSSKVLSLKHDE